MAAQKVTEVQVTVSQPYTVIGGGWSGMRPQGRRRDYTATAAGKTWKNTSKDEIARRIRVAVYQETGGRVKFTWIQV